MAYILIIATLKNSIRLERMEPPKFGLNKWKESDKDLNLIIKH